MSTEEKQSEAADSHEIRAAHPKVPGIWTEELVQHRTEAHRVSVRFLRMKGETRHDVGECIVRLDENTDRFRFEHIEDDGTLIQETALLSAKQVIAHMWAWACEDGLAYASKQKLTKLRGELAIFSEQNVCLNDPSTSRKVLNIEDPTRPYTDDDDADLDAGIRGELAYERRVNREHTKRFVNLVERIEDRAEAAMKADAMRAEASRAIDERSMRFTETKEAWVDKVLEEELGNARMDQLLEFAIESVGPKVPEIVDALCTLARNYGGKLDPLQVPDCPDELMFWVMEHHGASEFMRASACHMKARRCNPTSGEYQSAWSDALGLLSELLGADDKARAAVPAKLAKLASAWGTAAAKQIRVDPHAFSHLCFCEGADEPEVKPES